MVQIGVNVGTDQLIHGDGVMPKEQVVEGKVRGPLSLSQWQGRNPSTGNSPQPRIPGIASRHRVIGNDLAARSPILMESRMIGRIEVVVLVVAILTIGCTEHDTKISQSEVLRSLTHVYPGLAPSGVDAAEFYRPWRKSWSANSNVEMTLFGPPDSMDNGHRIVLFQDEISGSPLGLAFPSNASTDYWKFGRCKSLGESGPQVGLPVVHFRPLWWIAKVRPSSSK